MITLDLVHGEYTPNQPPSGIKFTKLTKTAYGPSGANIIELGEPAKRHIMRKLEISNETPLLEIIPILDQTTITLIFE